MQFSATGNPDESLSVKVVGLLQPNCEESLHGEKMLSFSLQKGQLKTNVCYRPLHYANLEVLISSFLYSNLYVKKSVCTRGLT